MTRQEKLSFLPQYVPEKNAALGWITETMLKWEGFFSTMHHVAKKTKLDYMHQELHFFWYML